MTCFRSFLFPLLAAAAALLVFSCTAAAEEAATTAATTCHLKNVTPRNFAPSFSAQSVIEGEFVKISLEQYLKAGKWVVLLFYPFDFTFVCPTEIRAFSEHAGDFASINTQVLGISTDSHHTHLAWIRTEPKNGGLGHINYPLVADTSKAISRAYGVLVEDENDGMYGAALRGLFIIDPSGKIRSVTINDDHVGRSVEETLRLIKGFQYADTHDVVCPAGWLPGKKTIKPNPEGIREYFKESL